jgi:hypothetical protein
MYGIAGVFSYLKYASSGAIEVTLLVLALLLLLLLLQLLLQTWTHSKGHSSEEDLCAYT